MKSGSKLIVVCGLDGQTRSGTWSDGGLSWNCCAEGHLDARVVRPTALQARKRCPTLAILKGEMATARQLLK